MIEKKEKLATKRQNSNDCDKQQDSASAEPGKYPAKRRVNFSTTESVTGSKTKKRKLSFGIRNVVLTFSINESMPDE